MKYDQQYSVLSNFDFALLDDPEFQEDAVREEIICPILKALGYSPAPPYRMIRSKKLLHPYVSIGSVSKPIYIVPDYLLEVNGRFAWTLEAKAPKQPLVKSKHVEQAYSYAIHSEVRVPLFALCNGRQLVLYNISKPDPIAEIDLRSLANYWENLARWVGPVNVLNYDFSLKKDFGLHLKRLGFDTFEHLIFPSVPVRFIAKMADDLYSLGGGIKIPDGDSYVASFDFDSLVLSQMRGLIPERAYELLNKPFENEIRLVEFADATYYLTVDCMVGTKIEENEDEIFLPLRINRILSS